MTASDIEAMRRRYGGSDVSFGTAHRGLQILTLRQTGGDGRGERASGAVGAGAGDTRRGQRDHAIRGDEIIDALGALPVHAMRP